MMSVFDSRSWTSAHTWSVKRIANSSTHALLVKLEIIRPTLLACLSNTTRGQDESYGLNDPRWADLTYLHHEHLASRKAGPLAAFGALIQD